MARTPTILKKLELLKVLKKINNKDRPTIIKYLDDRGVDLVCECVQNILFNNVGLNLKEKKRLRSTLNKRQKAMKNIANKSNSFKRRRSLLNHHGGNPLALILSTALPLLTDLLFRRK